MSRLADLHTHTYYSDSTLSPQELIEQAHQNGLSCLAVTDHDTVEGIAPSMEAARKYGIEIITGIELSSEIHGKEVHILGYLFNREHEFLTDQLNRMQDVRIERMKTMIEKLRGLGIKNIELEEVCALTKTKSVGRPHLATILKEKGAVSDYTQAFEKFLAEGRPAYVSKFKQTPYEAIALIRQAGGLAVLAHPMLTGIDELIPSLVKAGMKGLEVYYPNVPENVIYFYEGLAKKHHLLMTGGSDAHGDIKKNTRIGRIKIPYALVEQLKEAVRA